MYLKEKEEWISMGDSEKGILEIQRELEEAKSWDDKTHLERKYQMHLNSFDNVVRSLCASVGIFRNKDINERDTFGVKDQNGEQKYFDIGRDYNRTRGEDKLVSYVEFNENTKAHSLLHYSPTKGIGFEYGANLLPKNVQLGKGDFFGKTIENMIKNVASATEGVEFETDVRRFSNEPNGLERFYITTKDFVEKEKQGDVVSIIAMLDGLVRGIRNPVPWVHGQNFVHEKEGPLFNVGIKISI